MEGWAGAIGTGTATALVLVLADEPAMTCLVPGSCSSCGDRGRTRRRGCSRRRSGCRLIGTGVKDAGLWITDGPAVLFDAAGAGADPAVACPGGRSRRRCRSRRVGG
ncbi:hypothetical protein ACIP5N_19505 [Streptomyces sp. NPDC088768]|uniref:hypothetical protein n=1 Tax=Streptomyces sp. NPDC088768 TaxID=3365894 RepID=UPI003811F4F1